MGRNVGVCECMVESDFLFFRIFGGKFIVLSFVWEEIGVYRGRLRMRFEFCSIVTNKVEGIF